MGKNQADWKTRAENAEAALDAMRDDRRAFAERLTIDPEGMVLDDVALTMITEFRGVRQALAAAEARVAQLEEHLASGPMPGPLPAPARLGSNTDRYLPEDVATAALEAAPANALARALRAAHADRLTEARRKLADLAANTEQPTTPDDDGRPAGVSRGAR